MIGIIDIAVPLGQAALPHLALMLITDSVHDLLVLGPLHNTPEVVILRTQIPYGIRHPGLFELAPLRNMVQLHVLGPRVEEHLLV